MTVETQVNSITARGNGATTNWPYNFYVEDSSQLIVERQVYATGVIDKTYAETSEYTVSGIGSQAGGTVTLLGPALTDTYQLVIRREVLYKQELDINNQGGFYPSTLETQLDLMEMQIQQLRNLVGRSSQVPYGETGPGLPSAASRANKFLSYGADGTTIVMSEGTGADSGLRGDLASTASGKGASLVGYEGGGTVQDAIELRTTLAQLAASGGSALVGFLQAGTGAVATTTEEKLKAFISVTDFMTTAQRTDARAGTASLDLTTAVQAAVDAVIAAGGGTLWFPEGSYKIASEVTVSSLMKIVGVGIGSILISSSASANIFKVTSTTSNPGVIIEYLKFTASVTRTSGQYIESASAPGTQIRYCRFDNAYVAIAVTGAAIEGFVAEYNYIYAATSVCINITAATGAQGITSSYIQNNVFLGASSGSQTPIAIQIGCAGDLTIRGNMSLYCSAAVTAPVATGKTIQALRIVDNWFDSGSASGVTINPSGGTIHLATVRGNWIATFTADGVVASGTGTFGTLEIIDNAIGNNGGNGINIASTIVTETDIRGNKIGSNTNSGVNVVANLGRFKIIVNSFGGTGQWTDNGAYDVLINAGTADNYIVTHNFFTTGGSGALSDGGTGVDKIVTGNITI